MVMGEQIIGTHSGLHEWLRTPPGEYLLAWEQARLDQSVVDVFGYHALQLGLPELDGLAANRMPHRWFASDDAVTHAQVARRALACDYAALPFPEASLDLVVMPHTLELSTDPHATLREVARVLVPEGRVVITCLNPASLWGLRQRRAHLYRRLGLGRLFLPAEGEFIGYWRLRDWLRLLGFEVESSDFGCYRPSLDGARWLARHEWMDRVGRRWWPIFGAVYSIVAIKRVPGMRLLGPAWKQSRNLSAAPVPLTQAGHRWGADDAARPPSSAGQ
jgi:SAM-dependent methyltransferase